MNSNVVKLMRMVHKYGIAVYLEDEAEEEECRQAIEDELTRLLAPQPLQPAVEPVHPRHPVVVHWRNSGIEACAGIAEAYGNADGARDMRALITAAPQAQPAGELDYKSAYEVWQDKTEWVQETAQPHELGMHRADVLAKRLTDTANALASAHYGYQAKLHELETQKNELLRQAIEALSTCSGVAHWPTLEPVKNKLRAAIAKAEGGAG